MTDQFPIADLHCDTIQNIQAGESIQSRPGHVDIGKMQAGGVKLQVFACFISSAIPESHAYDETLKMLDTAEEMIARHSDVLQRVEAAEQMDAVEKSDKIGVMLAVENGHAIARDLSNLEKLRLRGVRYMTLTHSRHLEWAASSGESTTMPYGLNRFGKMVVEAMNEMGMIVDVSHVAPRTFDDVADICKKPFIASHSNAFAVCDSARNLTDEQLKTLAEKGGMTGLNFFSGFLDRNYAQLTEERCGDLFSGIDKIEKELFDQPEEKMQAFEKFNKDFIERMHGVDVPLSKIPEHILHIIQCAGDTVVGFGSDFDGVPDVPQGVNGSAAYPAILSDLLERKIEKQSLRKLCWDNFLRVLRAND